MNYAEGRPVRRFARAPPDRVAPARVHLPGGALFRFAS